MIDTLEKALGQKAQIDFKPEQPGDVRLTYADISKSKKEIGYNPLFDFTTGVENFVQWLNEQH